MLEVAASGWEFGVVVLSEQAATPIRVAAVSASNLTGWLRITLSIMDLLRVCFGARANAALGSWRLGQRSGMEGWMALNRAGMKVQPGTAVVNMYEFPCIQVIQ